MKPPGKSDSLFMKRICVFCGSKHGVNLCYQEAASLLGQLLAEQSFDLVYGGGQVGLMGIIADAILQAKGHVIGVIPEMLATKELTHPQLSELHVVSSMHERKALMTELSDAFIAMPGGYGTLEELFEVMTWAQLGIHRKPIGILNVNRYFDHLLAFLDYSIAQGFVKPIYRELFVVAEDPEDLLHRLCSHRMPEVKRWVDLDQS